METLIFGAGSTGRGHLAALLYEGGYKNITFVEKDDYLAGLLKKSGRYAVRLLSASGAPERTLEVAGFNTLSLKDGNEIIGSFVKADLILTAVIAENLGDLSALIARAIKARRISGTDRYANVICCENLNNASSYLKRMVFGRLSDMDAAYAEKNIGFPDAVVSRVAPLAGEDKLALSAEDYNEWYVDKGAFIGPDPGLGFMTLTDKLEAYLERKLWIHNGGHAALAYSGIRKGFKYVHEAVADGETAAFTVAIMREIGETITHKHGFPPDGIEAYISCFAGRGAIAELRDDLRRVARGPVRKLGVSDRLTAPALYAERNGLGNAGLAEAIAYVTLYYDPGDAESVRMRDTIAREGLECFFKNVVGLDDERLLAKIISHRNYIVNQKEG